MAFIVGLDCALDAGAGDPVGVGDDVPAGACAIPLYLSLIHI